MTAVNEESEVLRHGANVARGKVAMIKDVMVRLDGTSGDDVRLAAANQIADRFGSHIAGLFFNVLSPIVPAGGAGIGEAGQLQDAGKQASDLVETTVFERLTQSEHPNNLRRFNVASDSDISDAILPLARTADVFVALRPNGQCNEPRGLIESLLFGTGRHLLLVPEDLNVMTPFDNVVVAWNGSRASARALAESLPYLRQASKVGILVIRGENTLEANPLTGNEAVLHLRHHGINAVKYSAVAEEDEIGDVLVAECRNLNANLLVMGSYGHSRLHELLPGSTTDRVLHRLPLPLLIAH